MNNDFNNFNPDLNQPSVPEMPEKEQRRHRWFFSRLCIAILVYIVISQSVASMAVLLLDEINPELLKSGNAQLILSSAIQYLLAFPIFVGLMKKLPASAPEKKKLSGREIFKYLTVTVFVMYVGNYISSFILTVIQERFGGVPENDVSTLLTETDLLLSFAIAGIIGPIIEEIMFRKLLIDRLTPYGEAIAIFFPSLIFGLIHGNLYQFFYAFLIGAILSYVYVRSGRIIYTMIYHCFINLFCGVLPAYVMSQINVDELIELLSTGVIPEEYIQANILPLSLLAGYSFIIMGLLFIGIFNFNRGIRRARLNRGEIVFPKGKSAEIIFFNVGAIALITSCIILIALSTFSFAAT